MWQWIFNELEKVNVCQLAYDDPLSTGILDISSEPLKHMPEEYRNIFQEPIKKFLIMENQEIKQICNEFLQSEERKNLWKRVRVSQDIQDIEFGKLLDTTVDLQQMTSKMLRAL